MERTSSNGTKKRTNYVAGGGARAKTRPSLPRRKSSQGPPPAVAESKKSPRLPPRISPPRSPTIRESQARPPQLTVARHPPPGLPALPSKTPVLANRWCPSVKAHTDLISSKYDFFRVTVDLVVAGRQLAGHFTYGTQDLRDSTAAVIMASRHQFSRQVR